MQWKKQEKVQSVNTKNDYKKTSKKQTCPVCFVKLFKFQEEKFKIVQENFWEIIIKKISWKSHWSQWSLLDKNMAGQRSKIDGN